MITPIIMEADIVEVERKLELLAEQKVKRVHIDIGDGMLTEMYSIAPADLQGTSIKQFETDIHLLVDDPMEYVEECIALSPVRLIGQVERMGAQTLFVETVAGYGAVPGLALMIETPIEALEKQALAKCKTVLLLAIPAGTTGSPFDIRVINKIKELRKNYSGSILIDGGINPSTYAQVIEAGASEVGANSAWWRGDFRK